LTADTELKVTAPLPWPVPEKDDVDRGVTTLWPHPDSETPQ
jgi:hypothetical protein